MPHSIYETALFENADWRLTASGLEHNGCGYFIPRDQIGDTRSDGSWMWPVHMGEKSWCDPNTFAEAFSQALAAFGHEPEPPETEPLARSENRAAVEDMDEAFQSLPRRLGEIAVGEAAAVGRRIDASGRRTMPVPFRQPFPERPPQAWTRRKGLLKAARAASLLVQATLGRMTLYQRIDVRCNDLQRFFRVG